MTRTLVMLNGSPVRGSSVDLLLQAMAAGAEEAGGRATHVYCNELAIKPCQACGPDATSGYCIFEDAMDPIYAALESAHAIAVGSPIYFDTVSAQLKLVMDRCNCVTPLTRAPGGGFEFRPKWARTRRGVFVTACSAAHPHDLAERSVRGFLKWVGAKWEETLAWRHEDEDPGSVATRPELIARARAIGKRLIESPPLEP
ncbi:MAG: flavodoxin family protein [Candidatus Eisenbacteria bacterium]|uniref:Flavodoxin family protein n=1 Tax=Eiseniibacteriota bacterium TaxID=2212470 RepID=A0A9D6L6D0_UNCEI|nr:flavodoxin family protein [Candidatus Eisenbacteria bacterium]MBI3539446.1 flavodoxin family protein [Candidatus Eisenbacteria bacterium]